MSRYGLPDWSQHDPAPMPVGDPADAYGNGYCGAYFDAAGQEQLEDEITSTGQPWRFEDIASHSGIAGAASPTGTYLIYKEVEACGIPLACISRASQPVGNCVSRGGQNALLHTMCASHRQGLTGLPEGIVAACLGEKTNPVASEPQYWSRGRPGDGWYASACIKALKNDSGLVVRRNYSDMGGPDLSGETTRTAHAYYRWEQVPEALRKHCHLHPLVSVAEITEMEALVDAIAHGHAVHTDGGEGFSKECDADGVARRSGHWSHSMCVTGCCLDPAALKRHNTAGLFLIQNSWSHFNRTSHSKVPGTSVGIPPGSFFAKWEDIKHRSFFAYADITGWKKTQLPDWSFRDLV